MGWFSKSRRRPDAAGGATSFGYTGVPGESRLRDMASDELRAWENRGIANASRAGDHAEAAADERQDVTTGLNFPLHWTSAVQGWEYLFDVAIACELLAPRPDDRILDFAAGTCWVTEMLCRLGVRPVAMDLSLEMMRRGRHRLECDSRLVLRGDAGFVTARGQALPFADESFDGVLCMNALHHTPSYFDALEEIHRILRPGGRAVFSEPGTAHGAAALSAYRSREEGILEKAVSLPHIRRVALAAGFVRMAVVPLRSSGTYVFDYSAGDTDNAEMQRLWDDTLKHGAREHARFALYKAGETPRDTWLPAPQLSGRLGADIALDTTTASVRAGAPFTDRLTIKNVGTVIWRAHGRRFGGQVTCGLKIFDQAGTLVREDLGRTPIERDIAPGEHAHVAMTVVADLPPGTYELRYDMVVEGVTWFEFQGSPCPRRTLTVV